MAPAINDFKYVSLITWHNWKWFTRSQELLCDNSRINEDLYQQPLNEADKYKKTSSRSFLTCPETAEKAI